MPTEKKQFQEDLLESVRQMRTGCAARVTEAGIPNQSEESVDIALRLPVAILNRWKASGPDWQSRMEKLLSEII
jgi:putative transcriptional regulator